MPMFPAPSLITPSCPITCPVALMVWLDMSQSRGASPHEGGDEVVRPQEVRYDQPNADEDGEGGRHGGQGPADQQAGGDAESEGEGGVADGDDGALVERYKRAHVDPVDGA